MTQEEKAKAYDVALSKMKEIIIMDNKPVNPKEIGEYLFPSLKESEDERIKSAILGFLEGSGQEIIVPGISLKDAIAWLEKKDEKKLLNNEEYQTVPVEILDRLYAAEKELERLKQGEQKPNDKVEPKFKVGDWIVYSRNDSSMEILYVYDIRDGRYYFNDNVHFSWSVKECDEKSHLWTIQDAKDGDILATKKGNPFIYDKNRYNNGLAYYYAGLDVNKELTLKSPHHMLAHFGELSSVFPATKEQRDLLFQKMKESGYEWDTEKKELKKIEQKTYWSEEDEKMWLQIINEMEAIKANSSTIFEKNIAQDKIDWLKSIKDRVQPQLKQEWSEYDKIQLSEAIQMIEANGTWIRSEDAVKKVSNWLKSLKPIHWKPSEYDISLLEEIARNIRNNVRPFCSEVSSLEDLIKDLKTL